MHSACPVTILVSWAPSVSLVLGPPSVRPLCLEIRLPTAHGYQMMCWMATILCMPASPQSQAAASACQAELLSPSFDLDFLTNADLVRLDATSNIAKSEEFLNLLHPCSEMHDLQRAHSARPQASLPSSSADTAGHMSDAAEGSSFTSESQMTGLPQPQQPHFPSALYHSSQSFSVTSEDGPLASSGQGTSGDTRTTAHAYAPLGPDNSSEVPEGIQDLGYAFVTACFCCNDIDSSYPWESMTSMALSQNVLAV